MTTPSRQRTVVDDVLSWAGGRFYPNPNYTTAYLSSYARAASKLREEDVDEDDVDDDYASESPSVRGQGRRKRSFSEDSGGEYDSESKSSINSGSGSSTGSGTGSNESDDGSDSDGDEDEDEPTYRPPKRPIRAWNKGLVRQRPSTPTGEGGKGAVPFPEVAYQMISEVAAEDTTLLAWVQDGEAFEVRDSGERLCPILEKFFQHTKYSSFQRQLNMYGWKKCINGKFKGAFYNPSFHRDMDIADLKKIERRRPPSVGKKKKAKKVKRTVEKKKVAKKEVVKKEKAKKEKKKMHSSIKKASSEKAQAFKAISGDQKEPKSGEPKRARADPKRGGWTEEEDEELRDLVASYDARSKAYKWMKMAQRMKGRSGKQCRERWHNHLRPDLKKGGWSAEEDEWIMQLHDELGNQWTKIADHVPGRSDNDVKNRWHARMKKIEGGRAQRL